MAKKHSFGIDIDGTVTSQEFILPHINKAFNTNIQLSDVTQYDLTAAFPFPINQDEFFAWFKENELAMYKNPPLQQDAVRILNDWYKKAHLNFITAREDNAWDVTEQWFTTSNIQYDSLNIVGSASKVIAAKKHNVELFFEDKFENALLLTEELKIPVILFDAPYNRQPAPNSIIRVHTWQQAENWVKKEFGI